jgi:type IV secretion system protein VirD4
MPRSVVKTEGFSLDSKKGISKRLKAFIVFVFMIILSLQLTAQYIAYAFNYDAALGWCFNINGYLIYPFYRAAYWLYVLMSTYQSGRSNIAVLSSFIFSAGLILSVFIARLYYRGGSNPSLEALHGSAHWATMDDIIQAGLLDDDGEPLPEGVVIGGIVIGKETKMIRHNGREHVLCFAPTRSGKGISLVLPTLLDGWNKNAFILDIKGENYALTAGYRKKELGHEILKLDFTDPHARELNTSATFNPLDEVPLDYRIQDNSSKGDFNIQDFETVHSDTYSETSTIQQIVAIIIDPQGKGVDDNHWAQTASSLILGCITHLLYKFRVEGKGCPGLSDVLSELSKPGIHWRETVTSWMGYPHLGMKNFSDPIVHPIVAEEAQTLLSKPEKEAGSVISTMVSNLALFRDPVVAKNTSKSSFRIRDLMHHDKPVSLYLVINPNDQQRLTPLTRLITTQIIFNLAKKMEFRDGRSIEGYKHRLLLLLDEFPSLGKLDLFEKAMSFVGGYGIKAYIIVQDLTQIFKAYGKDENIRAGCHIQVAFAPNNPETAKYLSDSTGQTTIIKENYSESIQGGKLFAGTTRSVALQEVQRPLLTPDECRRLPGAKKDSITGDVIEGGEMLIFPTGFSCIRGVQTPYFLDEEMNRRSKIVAPEKSDVLC